jgi:predicted O-linked N-acetylglucosamine transferase (SPINDLY family)
MSDAQVLKAIEHMEAGRLAQAEALCRRVLAADARSPHAMRVLANVLFLQGRREQALHFGRAGAKAAPAGDAAFLASLGALMRSMGGEAETVEIFRRAVEIDPRNPEALVGWTEALLWAERFNEAAEAAREALRQRPGVPEFRHNLAIALEAIGKGEEAVVVASEVAREFPDYGLCVQFAATSRSYVHGLDAGETFEAHKRAGALLEKAWPAMPVVRASREGEGRRLRVAFMSPDLRRHAVCHFVEPVIAGLDRARFHVSCYMLSVSEDGVSARVKAKADAWHNVALLSSPAVAQRIREDRIDVLIETSG